MKRMMIIGSPGSGKSTLAKLIAQKEGLPLVHLDKLFWQEGWVETPAEEFDRRLAEAVEMDAWVIDGNYTRTISMRLKRADTVVFFGLSQADLHVEDLQKNFKALRQNPFGYGEWLPGTVRCFLFAICVELSETQQRKNSCHADRRKGKADCSYSK